MNIRHESIEESYQSKLLRKKILWVEIKAKEQEYKRLQHQIYDLEQAKMDISFEIQKKVDQSQKIADQLLEIEYEALVKNKI